MFAAARTRIFWPLLFGVVAMGAWGPAAEPPGSAKFDLTPETYPQLHTLVRAHDSEWRHLKVNWLTDVVAARKKAAAEDKPIVICYTGGAGYNEPLGVC